MDDYVFLVLAKLNADRLKLEREQRAAIWATDQARAASNDERDPRRSSRFTSDNDWRVQS